MTKKSSPFESPQTPTTREGSIENIQRDLRKYDGDLREQEKQIAVLIAKEPFLATKDWVYVMFLKYTVPAITIIIGGLIAYLVHFNKTLVEKILLQQGPWLPL